MIKALRVKNVKCFKSASFNFSGITVFCGSNSAGKSTALQTLLLLKQSANNSSLLRNALSLAGEYFSFGHVNDLVSHNVDGDVLSIGIDNLEFNCDLKKSAPENYHLELEDPVSIDHSLFSSEFHYLSAYRLCPQNSYDINCDTSKINIGIFGQYAVAELVKHGEEPAANQKLAKIICSHLLIEGDESPVNLDIAFKEAMKKITPNFDINVSDHSSLDKVSNSFPAHGTNNRIRPVNTGFGISYVLPIVLAALCTREGGYLLVENPEVHLHPAAQSMLAGLLTMAATCGIQVIMETHSDHIINGIRVYVKENNIETGFVTINSVREIDGERVVTEIIVDSDGGLSNMDEGFFDQAEKDLLRLF